MHLSPSVLLAMVASTLLSCRGKDEDTTGLSPVFWEGGDDRVPMEHAFFESLSLGELSLYSLMVEGSIEDRPDQAHRGAYGVGNGHAFTLMGLTDPLNTLHSAVGPTYDKEVRFFGDLAMHVEVDGVIQDFSQEWISQVRGAPVSVTRADTAGGISMYTVDLAPIPAGEDTPPALLRWLMIDPADGEQIRVCLDSYSAPELQGDVLAWVLNDGRSLALGGDWEVQDGQQCLDLENPDGPVQVPIYLSFGDDIDAALAGLDALGEDGDAQEELLLTWTQDTLVHWAGFQDQGVQLHTSDPRIEDLYLGLRTSIRVQQTAAGGISPMSRYTGVWLRDTIGPVRFFSRAGLTDAAREMLDYLYLCHLQAGDLTNACSSGLSSVDDHAEPDWASLPGLSGRAGAEGPSYVPLAWTTWARWSGDWEPIAQHWDYLSRALLAQEIDDQGRQTWSGDETFRLSMNVAFGLDLEEPWEETSWSSNSSLLMAAASDAMESAADQIGEDPALFAERAALARNALDTYFMQPEGHISAVRYYTDDDSGGSPAEARPFEDAMLKMLWVPAYSTDDPAVLSAIDSLRLTSQPEDGAFQSPLALVYQGNPLLNHATEGYATGMTPGYTLFALTELGAMDSMAAFNLLPYYADPAGQYSEGVLWDDGAAVQPAYDVSGVVGDFAARYRPWEGGIVADAMLSYLIGAEPTSQGLRLRPHLPNQLDWMDATQIQVRDQVLDLMLSQDTGGITSGLSATITAQSDVVLTMELPVPAWMDGTTPIHEGELRTLPGGEQIVAFDAQQISAGQTVSYLILSSS